MRREPARAYLIAVLSVLVAVILRLGLAHYAGIQPVFLLFVGAVMATAWVGGTRPGILATLLGAMAGMFFFTPPRLHFSWGDRSHQFELVLFLIEGLVISLLAGVLRDARDTAVLRQKELHDLDNALLHAGDAERRRIGQDLHDGLGQQLTGIALLGKALHARLTDRKAPEAADAEQIVALVNNAIVQTRSLARGLDPVPIGPTGLDDALSDLCNTATSVFRTACTFRNDAGPLQINPTVAAQLFRIAQEAVSNAIKHARPNIVEVRLARRPNEAIALSITNDGLPFQPADSAGGMGLRVMRHRATIIDGQLTITTPPESGGTVVTCTVPAHHIATRDERGEP